MLEMRKNLKEDEGFLEDCPYLAEFLNGFYSARIGIRILIGISLVSFVSFYVLLLGHGAS